MTMFRRMLFVLTLVAASTADVAVAQGAARRERLGAKQGPAARQQLEQRLRTGVDRVVRRRIGLNDDQMTRLSRTSAQLEGRRRSLVQEERMQRRQLRTLVLSGTTADQTQIATSLDRVLQLQRERIDLQIEEQRQLAAFMTPMQRAKYAALQEQIRRRVEGMRRAGEAETE